MKRKVCKKEYDRNGNRKKKRKICRKETKELKNKVDIEVGRKIRRGSIN